MPGAATPLQSIWAAIPPRARAAYLRRTAQAVLDELDPLADLIARETGRPRTEALLAELLPAVGGLHDLADAGPGWLADRRQGRLPLLRAGRRSIVVRSPLGVAGIAATDPSPWLELALEAGAALLAGNAVTLVPVAPAIGERLRAAFERGGVPHGLVRVIAPGDELVADAVVSGEQPGRKGTMLVLAGAPLERTVSGALWAAFAGAGRGPAAVGRLVAARELAIPLLARLEIGARRLVVGDPRRAETEVGPLAEPANLEQVQSVIDDAIAAGASLLCGGPLESGADGAAYFAPALLRGVPPDARLLHEPVPGPVLAVVEAEHDEAAIALVASEPSSTISVWSGDRVLGERIARALPADLTWVNEHGAAAPGAEVRLARHVEVRRLASQPNRLRSARWLPYDPALVDASTAATRLLHGRERERARVLRGAAKPLARTAVRLARELRRG